MDGLIVAMEMALFCFGLYFREFEISC